MQIWEEKFKKKITELNGIEDPAHDLLHFMRVVQLAKKIAITEKAKLEVVIPAAWLHDFVIIAKNDPRRSLASKISAKAAVEYLNSIAYPEKYFEEIGHAIESHSFSANISPQSLEAKIVQDADRLDALGAIGIARCFATSGILKTAFYSEFDPFCKKRVIDDAKFTIDHFYKKLFKISESLQTQAGRQEAERRIKVMKIFLSDLSLEIEGIS